MDFLCARADPSFATGTRRFRGSLRLPPPGWTRRARSLGASPALPDLGRRPRSLPAPHPRSGPRATLPPLTPRTPFRPQALAPGSSALPYGQGKCDDKSSSSRPANPVARDPGNPGRPGSPKLQPGAGGACRRGRGMSGRGPSTRTPPRPSAPGAPAGLSAAIPAAPAGGPYSPAGAATPPRPAKSSSAHSPQSRAGRSMQPLARSPAGLQPPQSPPLSLPVPLPSSASLEVGGPGHTGRATRPTGRR